MGHIGRRVDERPAAQHGFGRATARLDPLPRLRRDARGELAAGTITGSVALDLLNDMLAICEIEEMIGRMQPGGYKPLPGYDYGGPTHVSIGYEAAPTTSEAV